MANERKGIGILGGTFNPVHLGHLLIAQSAYEYLNLAKVLFIPCCNPPHKNMTPLLSADHRLNMVRLAIEGDLRFEVSDIEIQRGGISYAVDTVAQLHGLYPAQELDFIIGADSLKELHLWRNIYCLLRLCRFVSFPRPGYDLASVRPEDLHLDPPWPDRLLLSVMPGPCVDISSSDIRHRVAEGMSMRYLVPSAVEMYVAEHHLYT